MEERRGNREREMPPEQETPGEDKTERERGRTEKEEEWNPPRTYAQI
jgi:hypothetical protein